MDLALTDEHRMLQELARRFVDRELMPLEPAVLRRDVEGSGPHLSADELARVDQVSRELGLWGLDAPADVGGLDLPAVAMIGVNEALGRTVTPYTLPPDSPNLRMLAATVTPRQRTAYLDPYVCGEMVSAIGISEPGAGSDPAGMITRAVRDPDSPDGDWVSNGRKIWITRAAEADFTIVMAVTTPGERTRGMSAFLVDRDTPGFQVARAIPMIGGHLTYEVVLDDVRVPSWKLLGTEGQGFAPMQLRLGTRRLEMAAWSIGMATRALDIMVDHAGQRSTFGQKLAERGVVQGWVADAATRIHAARLMAYDAAWKIDEGRDVRTEISIVKAFATEMAWAVVDHAMQCLGAAGMTRELPLQLMAAKVRTMRIYDGPTEIHHWVVARQLLRR